jgi:hypothetical protein
MFHDHATVEQQVRMTLILEVMRSPEGIPIPKVDLLTKFIVYGTIPEKPTKGEPS